MWQATQTRTRRLRRKLLIFANTVVERRHALAERPIAA
jgi:hypothetical protein